MAGYYDILYPLNSRQGLDGGLNSKYERHLISDNESPSCQNVIFENGSVETRLGTSKLNAVSVGSFAGDGLYTRHTNTGAETMCAWFGGAMHTLGTTTFTTVASSESVFTAGLRVCAAEYENHIFFGYNGTASQPYKYNGEFTRHGIYPATTTMTVASSGAGVLSGAYVYAMTNVNTNLVESDISPLTVTFSVASKQILLTSIPTAPQSWGVNARYIYRTIDSGTTLFRVGTLSNNTATTFTDNVADASLGAQAPTDQGVPPKYSCIITHQNRLFCNDLEEPNLIWYSELGNPYIFKVNNFELIGDNSGDLVKGFAIHDNGLVVYTDNSAYMVYMPDTDPTGWVITKLRSSYGTKSPFGIFSYNNKQMFPAIQNSKLVGFAAIQGDAVDPDATLLTVSIAGSEMKSDRIEPDIFEIQSGYLGNISSIVYKNKAYIALTYGDSQTVNNRIYVFDFSISNLNKKQEASWVPWTGLNPAQFTIYGGELYYATSLANGFVYKMNISGQYNDAGSAIDSYFWTKEFYGNPGDEQYYKDFRYANLLYEKAGGYFMDVTYRTDSDTGSGNTKQIDLDPGGSLWGSMIWGLDNWGGGNDAGEDRLYLGTSAGKRIQYKFSNQNIADQKFKVIGLQFSYNIRGRR